MKYIVVALQPEKEKYVVHYEYSSGDDSLEADSSIEDLSDEGLENDSVTKVKYEQNYFLLGSLLAQTLQAIDSEMEEEVAGIAEDGVTAIMRTTEKKYHVKEFETLDAASEFLALVNVKGEADHTPAAISNFAKSCVSNIVLEVEDDADLTLPLDAVAKRFFVLKDPSVSEPQQHDLIAKQQRLDMLAEQVKNLSAMSEEDREMVEMEGQIKLRDLMSQVEALMLEINALEASIEDTNKSNFMVYDNPGIRLMQASESPAVVMAAATSSSGGMFAPALVRARLAEADQNNNNNFDPKGKEECESPRPGHN